MEKEEAVKRHAEGEIKKQTNEASKQKKKKTTHRVSFLSQGFPMTSAPSNRINI